jgi:hypothetical protein
MGLKTGLHKPIGLIAGLALLFILVVRPDRQGSRSRVLEPDAGRDTGRAHAPGPGTARQEEPVGHFFYLFDVSQSIHTGRSGDLLAEAIPLLGRSIRGLKQLEEVSPQRHRVGTIGALSLNQRPLCTIDIPRPTLFAPLDTSAVSRSIDACEASLRKVSPESKTDISGALKYAALALESSQRAMRGVILVSDLEEDLPEGNEPGVADLTGICVAVYSVITPKTSRTPTLLDRLQQDWKSRMRGWGVKGSFYRTVDAFSAQDLRDFFRRCERQ